MKNKISCLAVIVLFLLPVAFYAQNSMNSFSILTLNNFNKKIYSENKSHYLIKTKSPRTAFPDTANQKITKAVHNDSSSEIEIMATASLITDNPSQSYLNDSSILNLASSEVTETAELIKKSEGADPLLKTSIFVYNYIENKTYGIAQANAAMIINQKSGDCTEHAILTAALLRKQGIPARGVVGVILSPVFAGLSDVMVYHMWIEAYYDGKWQLIDSTRPYAKKYNRYIAFTYHDLSSVAPVSYLAALFSLKEPQIFYIQDSSGKN